MIDFGGAGGIYLIWGVDSADYRGGEVWHIDSPNRPPFNYRQI